MSENRDNLDRLLHRLSDGCLSESDSAELRRLLAEDPHAARRYFDYMAMVASLKWHFEADESQSAPLPFASAAESAPATPISRQRLPQRAIRPRSMSDSHRRIWVAFAASFLMAATCIFGMLAYLDSWWGRIREPHPIWTGGGKVAEIRRLEQVEWATDQKPWAEAMELGAESFRLKKGWAELAFFGGSRLILEGPAHLELRTSDSAYLHSGKALVRVDRGDFRLDGPGFRVIDLGTEFGLDLAAQGDAEIHVFDGAVEAALLDADGKSRQKLRLQKNEAARFGGNRDFQPVAANEAHFMRRLPTRPLQLELADLIAGGNGLGGGNRAGIDPATGRLDTGGGQGHKQGDYRYRPVVLSPYIDGVFIPDGSQGPVQIDSAGNAYPLPATSNQAYDLIRRGGTQDSVATIRQEGWKVQDPFSETNLNPVLGGIDYRSPGRSLIGMHANVGITFDLQALRETYTEHRIRSFEAVVGNVGRKGNSRGLADMWVLVDGKLQFNRNRIAADEKGHLIQIDLPEKARFLTLVTTDGGNGIGLDWMVLGDARLKLDPLPDSAIKGVKP